MFDLSQLLHMLFWPAIILLVVLAVVTILVALLTSRRKTPLDYVKKEFLFDTKTEFELFNILTELYGDRYYVFPQVHYVHLLQPNKLLEYRDRLVLRNKIDRKSADFVLCDKEQIQVRLVIELDGSSHELPKRIERDGFINEITTSSNLPLYHFKTTRIDREYVRSEIDRILALQAEVTTVSPK